MRELVRYLLTHLSQKPQRWMGFGRMSDGRPGVTREGEATATRRKGPRVPGSFGGTAEWGTNAVEYAEERIDASAPQSGTVWRPSTDRRRQIPARTHTVTFAPRVVPGETLSCKSIALQ